MPALLPALYRGFTLASTLLVLQLLFLISLPAAPAQFEGKRIVEVLFEPKDQPVSRDQLGISLRIRPGDLFKATELSKAIERLYQTGRFLDIVVDATESTGGVSLVFITKAKPFVGRITVEGVPEPPNRAQLVNAVKIDPGTEFVADELPQAADRLTTVLRANGFYAAKVTFETNPLAKAQETDVRFVVEPGLRARFGKPTFVGEPGVKESKLIRTTLWPRWYGLRGWKDFTDARMQRGLDRLRQLYFKKDFLQAKVLLESSDYDPILNRITPQVSIQPGSVFVVQVEGAKVSKGTLRNLIPVYQERTVDRELLLEGRNRLRDYFQSQGYFASTVEVDEAATSTSQNRILYRVVRGPRYTLVHIGISGNRYFDTPLLRERMNTLTGGTVRRRRGRFGKELIDGDVDSIIGLYRSNGFRDAVVTSRVETAYKGKPLDMALFVDIKEGDQWFVSGVDISGVDLQLYEQVVGLLSSTKGQPYSPAGVVADRDTILNFYFNNGYPDATLNYDVTEDAANHLVKVTYVVREGRRNFVREILISGLSVTRRELITSRLTFSPGDPLSQARLVETQRRLYDLGIFAKVDVAVQNPDGYERNKNVLLQLDEAKKYSLLVGLGAELGRIGGGSSLSAPGGTAGFSPRALIGITRLNFLGIGHTAGVTGRISNYQRRALLNYTAPQFRGNERYSVVFSGLYDYSRDVRTYTSTRYETGVQLLHRYDRTNTFQYRLSFRLVEVPAESLNIDPALIPIYSQPVRVGLVSASYIRDRRDDPLDSTRGSFTTLDGGIATRWLGSETQYRRLVVRNTTYHKVAREVIFARSTSFGWLDNYGPNPIPLPEKFYAGGSSTHRAFPDNQAGPRDLVTGFPIGGDAFLLNGLELRFPLLGDTLGGVLFHDAGNVYSNLGAISFRYNQRNLEDFDYMVHAVGFGLRIKTPIGPVRVDLAYGLNSPQFWGFEGTRDELINGGGNNQQVLQRVRHFQFHFSLGQTF